MSDLPSRAANGLTAAAMMAAFAVMPATVFLYLDRGMDLKDSGFHYAALAGLADISAMTTQFPVVWKLAMPEMGIAAARLAVFLLMLGAALASALVLMRNLLSPAVGAIERVAWTWAIAGGMFIFYFWWAPEPYYNSLSLILALLLVALLPAMAQAYDAAAPSGLVLAMLAGLIFAALFFCRQPLAIGAFLVGAVAVLAMVGERTGLPLRVVLPFLVGVIAFLGLAHLFVEPLTATWARLLGGFERRAAFGRDAAVLSNFLAAPRDLLTIAGIYWPAIAALGAGVWLTGSGSSTARPWRRTAGFVSGTIGAGIFLWTGYGQLKFTPADRIPIAFFVIAATCAIVAPVLALAFAGPSRERARCRKIAVASVLLCAMPFTFAAGSADALVQQTLLSAGFFIAAGLLVSARISGPGGMWRALPFVATLAAPVLAGQHYMVSRPYGLLTPLSGQTVPTPLRGGAEYLLLDPAVSRFLSEAGAVFPQIPREPSAPVLIDLTGNLPFLVYHLGMRPIASAWVKPNGRPETVAYFERMLQRLSPEDRRSAWVAMAPGDPHGFVPDTLAAIGRDLARDYETAVETSSIRVPDPKAFDYPIRILRPRAEKAGG